MGSSSLRVPSSELVRSEHRTPNAQGRSQRLTRSARFGRITLEQLFEFTRSGERDLWGSMAGAMVAETTRIGEQDLPEARERQGRESELERRYEALLALVLRTGAWLTSNESGLDEAAWQGAFASYRENLGALKALGEELRPTTLRDGEDPLAGRELAAEAAELFAA